MLATHNSLTYEEPKYKIFNLFKWLWRCQDLSLHEQIEFGVKYFDIRIRINKKGKIIFCHGLVDLDTPFVLDTLLFLFQSNGLRCRLLLEKGDRDTFEKIVFDHYLKKYSDVIQQVIIKKGWIVLYGKSLPGTGNFYIPFYTDRSFWKNLKTFKFSTPRRYANKHNPLNFEKYKNDKPIHYFDFVDYE